MLVDPSVGGAPSGDQAHSLASSPRGSVRFPRLQPDADRAHNHGDVAATAYLQRDVTGKARFETF
ncbi:MAG: hypothetical protein ACRDQF_21580, partial [Thermocrispum sp.]